MYVIYLPPLPSVYNLINFSTVTISVHDTVVIGEFFIIPKSYNATSGESVVFSCQHKNADHVTWNISSRELSGLFLRSINGALYQLSTFVGTEHILDLNGTRVWCVAILNGFPPQESSPAKLLIQGNT